MRKYIILQMLAAVFIMASCARSVEYDNVEYREYRVLNIDPPKHFHLDLKDVVTGKVYTNVYVSKHCNNYRDHVAVGDTLLLQRVHWTIGGNEYSEFIHLYESICK